MLETMNRFILVAAMAALSFSCGGNGKTPSGKLADMGPGEEETKQGEEDILDLYFPPQDGVTPDGFVPDTGGDGVVDPCLESPSPFGCPCMGNKDCQSGYCVSTGYGSQCTMECIEECPDDWVCKGMTGYGDLIFLCVPPVKLLCVPCLDDTGCGGGRCLEIGGEKNCAYQCDFDSDCPFGFACTPSSDEAGADTLCMPVSGSCTCLPEHVGTVRPCTAQNDFGVCAGFETCTAEAGWTDCTATPPEEEVCDGKDNDCDGSFDEGLDEFQPCENTVEDIGTCTGNAFCGGTQGWVCPAPTPEAEACDYKDNDCDGLVDEDFQVDGKYATPENCGSCLQSCEEAIANGTAFCDASLPVPQCSVAECDPGYFKANAFQCLPEGQTQCKPCFSDNQCEGGACLELDGQTVCIQSCEAAECPAFSTCGELEETPGSWCLPDSGTCTCTGDLEGKLQPCTVTNEFGTCFGQESCDPSLGWVDCTAATATAELCDGLDNDCNGLADDGLGIGEACEVTVEEIGSCPGIQVCMGEQGYVCNAPTPKEESCDYQDNDCDGLVDEDFLVDGKYVALHHCGSCTKDCEGALPNAVALCDGSGEAPVCKVEACLPGFYPLNDFQCIVPPDVQCLECKSGEDCYGMTCAVIDGLKHCLKPCEMPEDCKEGYACEALGEQGLHCLPTTGTCQCTPDSAGTKTSCKKENEFGVCFGSMTCDPEVGWSECQAKTPAAEVCNGADDDCDGLTDEDLPETQSCEKSNEFGTCEGFSVCGGAPGWVCQAQTPAQEVCDYQDNDCDGETDEAFKQDGKYHLDSHCGTCNNACADAIPHATGVCDSQYALPKCVVGACDEGYYQVSPFQCIVPPDTTCQLCSSDEECLGGSCLEVDGELRCLVGCQGDEECAAETACLPTVEAGDVCYPVSGSCSCNSFTAGSKRSCLATNDIGTCFGFETCDPELGWSSCDAAAPGVESCDGKDNDCNGLIDDGLPPTKPCSQSNQHGECEGFAVCLGTPGWVCQAAKPGPEYCDYVDNNCDGNVDELYKTNGKYASFENCGSCGQSCEGALPNATAFCDASGETPICKVETCNEGYYQLNDFQCIVPPDVECQACTDDGDCYLDKCVPTQSGDRCLALCPDGACSDGYECQDLGEPYGAVCMPSTGSCDCSPESHGIKRACSVSNDFGTCFGYEQCDGATGWLPCDAATPADEICDGKDNDCNGVIDDGLPDTQPCEKANEFGTCTGESVCLGQQGWVCQAAVPKAEVCDYSDNDCDGTIDEDFKEGTKYVDIGHCGSCNNACLEAIPNATGKCDPVPALPRCVVDTCDEGYYKLSDFQCVVPPDSTCDPCVTEGNCYGSPCLLVDGKMRCALPCEGDGDCGAGHLCQPYEGVGLVCQPLTGSCECNDQTAGAKRACEKANEFGTCSGFEICHPTNGWSGCDAAVPAAEICDGKDNDCNGDADDGLPATQPCAEENEFGTCSGTATCGGTKGWECNAPTPAAETCDHEDNDCDGGVDEDFRNEAGLYDEYLHCGDCNQSCKSVIVNGTAMCDATGEEAECVVASCNPGYFEFSDYQCLSDASALCGDCAVDGDCAAAKFHCLASDGEKFCTKLCDAQETCPGGYTCTSVNGADYCVPDTGSCSCDGSDLTLSRACQITFPPGVPEDEADAVCLGYQPCTLDGWGACVVPGESCDGVDNDCDGEIDEDFKANGQYVDDEHCGSCGNDCTNLPYDNVVGSCDGTLNPPSCAIDCVDGFFNPNGKLSDGCECEFVSDEDHPDGIDQNCDGMDGEADNGLFVAAWGDDGNAGTREAPLRTLHEAMAQSLTSGKRDIYVTEGLYTGSLLLVEGVRLYGGYSDNYALRDSLSYESEVKGDLFSVLTPAPLTALAIQGESGSTVVDGFTFTAVNATTAGGSSYATYIKDCTDALVFRRNVVVAGNGAPGNPGTAGQDGPSGQPGTPGLAAIAIDSNICVGPEVLAGGAGAVGQCGETATSGGSGGASWCPTYEGGPAAEEYGISGSGTAPGAGGLPGWDGKVHHASCKMCTFPSDEIVDGQDGYDGAAGQNGTPGLGCNVPAGQPGAAFWYSANGNLGGAGSSGSGGGGGGSGGGGDSDTSKCTDVVGGTGGGGGAGGCSGTGGSGGAGGGGSFGLFLVFSEEPVTVPTIEDNMVVAGYGGSGGQGGTGGSGGAGGAGAPGGAAGGSDVYCTFGGGAGGYGGTGGHGGGGGGGCGGASFCSYAIKPAGLNLSGYKADNSCVMGAPGAGGLGGVSFGVVGQNGQSGLFGEANF